MDAPKNISEFPAFPQPERPCTCRTSGECDTCRSWSQHYHGIAAEHRRRVGGGALACWPPSAAQTGRAVFPHPAFTKMRFRRRLSEGIR
jgi:hypothetical protein